jgi:hypothetical protein
MARLLQALLPDDLGDEFPVVVIGRATEDDRALTSKALCAPVWTQSTNSAHRK